MENQCLRGITWDHSRGYDPLVACSEEYFKQKNIRITWTKRSLKNFGDQSLQDLSEEYDLLVVDHPHMGMAAEAKCLAPLDNLLSQAELAVHKKQSTGPSFESYTFAQHQWALPVDAAAQCAVFRPNKMCSPIPKNWQQLLETDNVGMALCPTDSLCTFLSLLGQSGNSSSITEGEQLVSESVGIKILSLLKTLKSHSHPDSINWNPIQLLDYMSQENDISYAPFTFGYTNYSRAAYRPHLLHFTNPPRLFGSSNKNSENLAVLGGAGMAISAQSGLKNEAANFVKWICSADIQAGLYTQAQGQPGNVQAWLNSAANVSTENFFTNTLLTLQQSFVRPRFANWPVFQEYLGEFVHEYLRRPVDEKSVIRHLNHQFKLIS